MRTLGLFARQPVAGTVKTRLARASSPEWAALAASAFLADTLDRMAAIVARRLLVFTPDDAGGAMTDLAGVQFEPVPQGPGDLGERLARFIGVGVNTGPVVVIGSDSPTLPAELVEEAYRCLEQCDVVLGPATDGGYYLVGCRRFLPSLFSAIDWGGPRVLLQTVERLDSLDATLALLQPWYDVDTLDDWHMMVGHLAALRRTGVDPQAPRTVALLGEGLR